MRYRNIQHSTGDAKESPKPTSRLKQWPWSRYDKEKAKKDQPTSSNNSRDWIKGVVICAWIIAVVLTLNIILTIIAAALVYTKNSAQGFAFASLYTGKCSVAKGWSTGLHVVINILSTAMLGASNYCMQCLASPSRAEVDDAHRQRTWLSIGVPNIFDLLLYKKGKRRLLGFILLITSLPIHLMFVLQRFINSKLQHSFTDALFLLATIQLPTSLLGHRNMQSSWHRPTNLLRISHFRRTTQITGNVLGRMSGLMYQRSVRRWLMGSSRCFRSRNVSIHSLKTMFRGRRWLSF